VSSFNSIHSCGMLSHADCQQASAFFTLVWKPIFLQHRIVYGDSIQCHILSLSSSE
jgi:hypothetical protein